MSGSSEAASAGLDRIAPYFSSRSYLLRVQTLLLIDAIPAATLPLWWGKLQAERGYTMLDYAIAQDASAIGGLMAGVLLAAIITRVDRRLAVLAMLALYAAALMGIVVARAPLAAAALWGVAFFAMTGLEGVGLAYLGYSRTAQRNNGIYVTVQTLMFGIAPLALPGAILAVGTNAVLLIFAGLLALAAVVSLALPARLSPLPSAEPVDGDGDAAAVLPRTWWIAAGCAVTAYAVFAWYTVGWFNYSEQFGATRGIDLPMVGLLLGIAGFVGVPGSLLAAYGDHRWPAGIPMIGGTLLFLLSCGLLGSSLGGTAGYGAGLMISSFSWSLLMPYLLSLMARIDPYGRVLAISYSVKGVIGVALAAANTAAIVHFGLSGVAWLCGGCALLTLASYLVARRLEDGAGCRSDAESV